MPKENRKRGRRGHQKRKREEEEHGEHVDRAKRQKSQDNGEDGDEINFHYEEGDGDQRQDDFVPFEHEGLGELQFYGMLDEQEQEYFRQADSTLELNSFADPEEKTLFLNNLWKEAKGKELKIANSQSCSRLMERLIAASNSQQIKILWTKFSTHFLNLFQHRFASHCCEALFRQAAPIVSFELSAPDGIVVEEGSDGKQLSSMEDLFLACVEELEGNFGYLIADPFASHPLRVLLAVLSGMSLEDNSTTSLLQSKKKERNIPAKKTADIAVLSSKGNGAIPASFHTAIDTVILGVTANLDTSTLRPLATHPIANPVLQLLLTLSLSRSSRQDTTKDPRSIFRLLLPDDPPGEGTESAAFVNHLLYDPIGSRLLEVIVTHAPGKTFKTLFRSLFKDRLGGIAKNETAGFVVMKMIERLGQADLKDVLNPICNEIGTLVQRSRTGIVKTLIERSHVREIDATPIADALRAAYGDEASQRLRKILNLAEISTTSNNDSMSAERRKQLDTTDTSRLNGSLLAQSMLATPGPLRDLMTESILAVEMPVIVAIAEDRTASRVLQAALTSPNQDLKFRRQFMPLLYPYVASMATHTVASHVVDALWEASAALRFAREQMAAELLRNETSLRVSVPGRAIWRNWNMDMYKTRRRDWSNLVERGQNDKPPADETTKTGIELARERYALKVQKQARAGKQKWGGSGKGANAVKVN